MTLDHHFWVKFLNALILLGSIAILVVVSIELLASDAVLSKRFILNFHLAVCSLFLTDFFVRWLYSGKGWRFPLRNLFLLFVSIPYLNIVHAASLSLSHTTWVLLRLFPLARGIYGISLLVGQMTRSKMTNLFVTYLVTLATIVYLCSIMFYFVEHGPNRLVKDYWDAFNWSLMNVTTVGSNIFGVTKLGQSLAAILAASGMVFFPIFTAWVTTTFQAKRNRQANNTQNLPLL